MPSIKIPTPLRAYTGGNAVIEVSGETVGALLDDLTTQHPDLRQHLYDGDELRNFVNVFIGQEDVRYLDGLNTDVDTGDQLRIIPSIAGGSDAALRRVDHSALRTNQAIIITLLSLAFLLNTPAIVAFVAAVMVIGTLVPSARLFVLFYKHILKPRGWVQPDVIEDNPEPHRFSMALGGIFTTASTITLLLGAATLGWALSLIVVGLAALNLFGGFCAGCFMYYQFNKFGFPGFTRSPITTA